MKMALRLRNLGIMIAAGALAACGGGDGNRAADNQQAAAGEQLSSETIFDVLSNSANHSSFLRAVEAAGLTETLRGPGPYTVFAPSTEAFDRSFEQGEQQAMLQPDRRGDLTGIITYHIVPGTVTIADLRNAIHSGGGRAELATIAGGNLSITGEGQAIRVSDGSGNQAAIVTGDQQQSNGVIHTIDHVMRPGGEEGAATQTPQ
jgi:uncharacterized surface protein with fasciclin (FAS1) repeats